MDKALVEHAQHDVHRDDRREDQDQLVAERGLKRQCGALKHGDHADRHADVFLGLLDRVDRLAERGARRQVERHRRRRELPEMLDFERRRLLLDLGDRRHRHLAVHRGRGRQVDRAQRTQRLLHHRVGFEDHPVLVRLGEDRRDDALAERVVERIVDGRRGDAKARGGRAVDVDIGGKAVVGKGAGDILDLRDLVEALQQLWHPGREFRRVRVFEHELVLRAADRCVDRQILHRLHVERDAGDLGDLALRAGG